MYVKSTKLNSTIMQISMYFKSTKTLCFHVLTTYVRRTEKYKSGTFLCTFEYFNSTFRRVGRSTQKYMFSGCKSHPNKGRYEQVKTGAKVFPKYRGKGTGIKMHNSGKLVPGRDNGEKPWYLSPGVWKSTKVHRAHTTYSFLASKTELSTYPYP